MAQSGNFSKVGNISELVNMSTEDRARYSISIDTYRTNLSVMQLLIPNGRYRMITRENNGTYIRPSKK